MCLLSWHMCLGTPAACLILCWALNEQSNLVSSVRGAHVMFVSSPCVLPPQRGSNAQPTLLQKLPGGVSVEAPKQNIAAGQAAVFAGLGTWAILQVGWQQSHQPACTRSCLPASYHCMPRYLLLL
jgi:hypothetical protein